MANEILTGNALVLVKIEGAPGVDAAPTIADAILVESIQSPCGINTIDSTEMTGSLDVGDPQAIGAPSVWTITARLRGAIGAITALNLPPLDPLFRCAGLKRTFLASIAAAALTAGSATSATLPAAFDADAQKYRGAPIVLGGPNHAGKVAAITDYTAGRVATLAEEYAPVLAAANTAMLPACALYVPNSEVAPTVTIYHYRGGKLRKLLGAKATFTDSQPTGNFGTVTMQITGSWGGETDAPIPAGAAPVSIAAPLFVQGALAASAFLADRKPVALSNLTLNLGATLVSPPDPNTMNGFGGGVLTRRDIRLQIDPQQTLVATRDVFADLFAGRPFPLVGRAGTLVGNRIQITVPSAKYVGQQDGDREGIATDQLEVKASGIDSGFVLAIY